MKRFRESLERYKRIFPEACEGKSDIEILLLRGLINQQQAEEMLKPKTRKARVAKPKVKKVRPYTSQQISRMCKESMKDFLADYSYGQQDLDKDKLASISADVAYEMAEGMLLTDERMKEYFRRSRVEEKYWKESLADYFV